MTILECLHTNSSCFQEGEASFPIGIVLHSSGVNQPKVKRWVQPSPDDPHFDALIEQIGRNDNGNSWNRSVAKSAHYVIGQLADCSVGTIRILPETICSWTVGRGKLGSYNYNPTAHIQIEICEDGLADRDYWQACCRAAITLCADICMRWGWESDVIVSHKEAYRSGYGSNHSDPEHWFSKFGFTMEDFRKEVDTILHPAKRPAVGNLVSFTGTKQYTSANKLVGKACKPGTAKLLWIYQLGKARHPYLIRAVSGGGSTVYGWVDEKDVRKKE